MVSWLILDLSFYLLKMEILQGLNLSTEDEAMIEQSADPAGSTSKTKKDKSNNPGSSLLFSNLTVGGAPIYDFSSKPSTQRASNLKKLNDTSNVKASADTEWANNSDDSVLLSLLKDGIKGSEGEDLRNGLREMQTEQVISRNEHAKTERRAIASHN